MSKDEKQNQLSAPAGPEPSRRELLSGLLASASTAAAVAWLGPGEADAQQGCVSTGNCQPSINKELVNPGELKRGADGFLRGVVTVEAEQRNITYYAGKNFFCKAHMLRAYHGYADVNALRQNKPVTLTGVASPGPTLRAQVGDTVQLMFLNRIDTTCFNDTPLTGEGGGCEVGRTAAGQELYPKNATTGYEDKFPDCFRVSNTTNIHFHGTHTTPGGFGDNVLVGVLPNRKIALGDATRECDDLFKLCAPLDSDPKRWSEDPAAKSKWDRYQAWYKSANTTLSKMGTAGAAAAMSNSREAAAGEWPQYWPGYYPYYFTMPKYEKGKAFPAAGQTPGTHWYHAHQHGSTSIQLLNGMAGAIVLTSPDYDGQILSLGGGTAANPRIKEKVMVLQLFAELTNLMTGGTPQSLCVNGQLQPVVSMKPGEVQWWRIANASIQSHGISTYFFLEGSKYDALVARFDQLAQNPPVPAQPIPTDRGTVPQFRLIAKDGVQFAWENYVRHAADANFQVSPGNRVDFLIQAPQTAGDYVLVFWPSFRWPTPNGGPPQFSDLRNQVVLRARVGGTLAGENTSWYDPTQPSAPANYPVFPEFLGDIPESEIQITRKVEFSMIRKNTQQPVFMIDGKQFNEGVINKVMLEGDAEEWLLVNSSVNSVQHPFHIHINPFQIVEVFDPSLMEEPQKQPPKFIWQDTVGIPAGFFKPAVPNPDPTKPGDYKFVPGHIRIRHRFLDFPGKYVLHCHILGHEDRGMMQLVEMVPNKTMVKHH